MTKNVAATTKIHLKIEAKKPRTKAL